MWIVRLALRRPYTFVIVALLIVLLGVVTIVRTPTDIFPDVNIPVVSVIWSLTGTSVTDMEARIVTPSERAFTTSVNDIEHIESQTMPGVGVIKVFFHPNTQIGAAIAEVTAVSQQLLRTSPPGTTPPLILQYNASSVPILQLGVASKTRTEGQLYDYSQNFIRTQLATVQGASVMLPYGGKPRQVMVDLDPQALQGNGLSAADVVGAVSAQNLVLPTGTAKIGSREYPVLLNSSPDTVAALNNLPIKQVNGKVVYIHDVAQVRDGFAVQQNIVTSNGQRGSLLSVLKAQGASTLAIVQRVKAALPAIQATLPPELRITPLFDQSIFVRAALNGVVREGAIAAVVTGLMILVFLGSWRSTVIVAVSIPLSILTSLILLGALGYTINIMTLGGLGLAVGILVDDATVTLENVHRNLGLGSRLRQAILDGAQQIATPALVSTLSICIVFVPVLFLSGIVQFLFTPSSGQDFFPQVAAGQFRLHVRVPASTRLEATDQLFNAVEARIRQTIPPDELGLILTNIGLPVGGVNLAFSDGATTGSADGEILVSLKAPGKTFAYVRELRRQLPAAFPQATFFFSAADIVSQILNFGLPAPIDIQVVGANPANQEVARRIAQRITSLPGVVDVHVHQITAAPALHINVDRTRAAQVGLTQRDIASSVLVSLAGSGDGSPNFWLDPKNGVDYRVGVPTPHYRIDSVDALAREPLLATTAGGGPQLLTKLPTRHPRTTPAVADHYNVQRVFDVFASVQDRDLGGAPRRIGKVVADERRHLPRGSTLTVRGQVQSMNAAFLGLGGGMIFAVVLVYALMVVNFQSWLDPFIIITALPGAIAGVLWAVFVTPTTVNVPSLMGAIMSIGVATANSILVVPFANDGRQAGHDAVTAALSAGVTRLRPVLMTALAMIIGMFPMALGLGEGGEQNAPLGRAVIGGLVVATVVTLFVVPVFYSLFRGRAPHVEEEADPS